MTDINYRVDVLCLLSATETPVGIENHAFDDVRKLIGTLHDIPAEKRSTSFYLSALPIEPTWPETIAAVGRKAWEIGQRHHHPLLAVCLHKKAPAGVIELLRTRIGHACYFFARKAGSEGHYYLPVDSNGRYGSL